MNIKKEKNSLLEDIKRLKQDKQALEVDLEKMKKERDQAKDQVAYVTGKTVYLYTHNCLTLNLSSSSWTA